MPLSTSCPLSRTWTPCLSKEPNAMYSASAQSHTRWATMFDRPFRTRLRPAARGEAESEEPGGFHSLRRTAGTSVYGEVFHRDGGGDVSDVTKLVFADAGGRAAHGSRLTIKCEKF